MSMTTGSIKKVSAPVFNNGGREQRDNNSGRQSMEASFQKFLDKHKGNGAQIINMELPESPLPMAVIITDTTGSMSGGGFGSVYNAPKQGETFRAYNRKGELV